MCKYEVTIRWSGEDGAFVAEAPELPDCAAHGDTADAALARCHEAIGLWIDTALEHGRPLPEPSGHRLT
jgi:predicted RNase H-like HicB family nuclease